MSVLAWILLIVFIGFFVFEVVAFTLSMLKKRKEKKMKQNTSVDVNNVLGAQTEVSKESSEQQ